MNLSTKAKAKLGIWASSDTWTSGDDPDLHRFFEFINQYAIDHGHLVDESQLKDKISLITDTPTGNDNDLEVIIRNKISLMVQILDFLKVTSR